MPSLTLASNSTIRATLLRNAGMEIEVKPARIDEDTIIESLQSEGANPHDISDALAEHKALRASRRDPSALVLGCDQLLECEGQLYQKPKSPDDALRQLHALAGKTHRLHTAAVLYAQGEPVWRHVSTPRLTMRTSSDAFLQSYVTENWDDIRHCVGCYQIEGPGIRLFSKIEGDLFAIQGLPLLELLSILTKRKDIPG